MVHLRTWRSRGFHFRRQAPRDGFILDFVCLKQRLIIEVDGGQHNDPIQEQRDRKRELKLSENKFKILRFWNNEIDQNIEGVLQVIDRALQGAYPHPAAKGGHPPPQAGEG